MVRRDPRLTRFGPILALLLLAGCDVADSGNGTGGCAGGGGFADHKYFSEYYCAIAGGWIGLSWRSLEHCEQQCQAAAAWGCEASACASNCATDHGTGACLPCVAANGGEATSNGCFLDGSGLYGETVACDCR